MDKIKQYKTKNNLDKALYNWVNDVVVNRFGFKGDVEDKEQIKKFYKTKRIHTILVENTRYETKTVSFYHKDKLKYECKIDYVNLKMEVVL